MENNTGIDGDSSLEVDEKPNEKLKGIINLLFNRISDLSEKFGKTKTIKVIQLYELLEKYNIYRVEYLKDDTIPEENYERFVFELEGFSHKLYQLEHDLKNNVNETVEWLITNGKLISDIV